MPQSYPRLWVLFIGFIFTPLEYEGHWNALSYNYSHSWQSLYLLWTYYTKLLLALYHTQKQASVLIFTTPTLHLPTEDDAEMKTKEESRRKGVPAIFVIIFAFLTWRGREWGGFALSQCILPTGRIRLLPVLFWCKPERVQSSPLVSTPTGRFNPSLFFFNANQRGFDSVGFDTNGEGSMPSPHVFNANREVQPLPVLSQGELVDFQQNQASHA